MNNFTREELACIRDNIVVPESDNDKSKLLTAYHKILDMIDNYCEHGYNEKSVELHAKQCCKCQEVKVL